MRSSPGFLTCPKPLTEARPITEAGLMLLALFAFALSVGLIAIGAQGIAYLQG
jgi:hypothetical protein